MVFIKKILYLLLIIAIQLHPTHMHLILFQVKQKILVLIGWIKKYYEPIQSIAVFSIIIDFNGGEYAIIGGVYILFYKIRR